MYSNILSAEQKKLLGLLSSFSDQFYLSGGTAIALQIGHRQSIDFDLFKDSSINSNNVVKIIKNSNYSIQRTLENTGDEFTAIINNVKITFLYYPFAIDEFNNFDNYIQIPTLINLAAMKAYTLGRRPKWKDYVDLYFLFKSYFTIDEISEKAISIYGNLYNEKLFREQLCYFEDIDYSESVNYIDTPLDKEVIKSYLIDVATE